MRRLPDWRRFLAAIMEATRAVTEEEERSSLRSFFLLALFSFFLIASSPFAIETLRLGDTGAASSSQLSTFGGGRRFIPCASLRGFRDEGSLVKLHSADPTVSWWAILFGHAWIIFGHHTLEHSIIWIGKGGNWTGLMKLEGSRLSLPNRTNMIFHPNLKVVN